MNTHDSLDVLHLKVDLLLELSSIQVELIGSQLTKTPHKSFMASLEKYKQCITKHEKKINEYIDNTTGVEDQVS